MCTIAEMNRRIQAVDLNSVIAQSIQETSERAAQFNRDDLSVGLLATSNPIIPPYSPQYAKKKGFTTPDLYVTGAFYSGINMQVQGKNMFFSSTDEKAAQLGSRYTKFIYGLTQDSKSAYSLGTLRPVLNQNLRNALGV